MDTLHESILPTYFPAPPSLTGKHRKHPGGRGNAGGMHHHRTWWDKFHPGYFGKVGMRHFHHTRNPDFMPTVNVEKLGAIVGEQLLAGHAKKKATDKLPVIDVTKSGFFKVLGKGKALTQPIIVKAKFFSKKAEKKIKAAGGVAVLTC
jgi:large subunit ribosomal protein L27Ae